MASLPSSPGQSGPGEQTDKKDGLSLRRRLCTSADHGPTALLCKSPLEERRSASLSGYHSRLFPLSPTNGVYRNVLFLKRSLRGIASPGLRGIPSVSPTQARPRSILCKRCMHGRGKGRSPPSVFPAVPRVPASLSTLARGVRDRAWHGM